MGLRELDQFEFKLRQKKNLQVSSTLIMVTSTSIPSMHNSDLEGNFQIAICTILVYLEKGAKKLKHVSLLGQVVRQESLFTFSFVFSQESNKFGGPASVIFLCV